MKTFIFLTILSLIFIANCQERSVYFFLMDSSQSVLNGDDGESQFFDYPSGLNVEVPFIVSANSTFDLFEKIKPFFANFSINPEDAAELKVESTKTYWRNAGYLPYDLVIEEMDLANEDPMHVPDMNHTQLSVMYFVYKMPIAGQAYQIKHEINEICVKVSGHDYRHFIIDRAYNGIFPNVWNTRLRLIYTGNSSTCDFEDNVWADQRTGNWTDAQNNSFRHINLVGQGNVKDYSLGEFVYDLMAYFQAFPIYNTLYNCQHFGANLFNKMTGQNITFISDDVMVRTEEDGSSNLGNLLFGFLEKSDDDHDADDNEGKENDDNDEKEESDDSDENNQKDDDDNGEDENKNDNADESDNESENNNENENSDDGKENGDENQNDEENQNTDENEDENEGEDEEDSEKDEDKKEKKEKKDKKDKKDKDEKEDDNEDD